MKIEIWSDIVCPFCYIGKRRFEKALAQFEHRDEIEVEWKSFQLSPGLKSEPGKSIHQFLAEHKGIPLNEAKGMNDYVTQMAAQEGLKYDFDKAVVANSLKAHQLIHFAKANGKQEEAEELLFRAYFTEGKDIDDPRTLSAIADALGLDENDFTDALDNKTYYEAVFDDIEEAQGLGVQGVPFFVIDRKYGVSGAQAPETFLDALSKAYTERQP